VWPGVSLHGLDISLEMLKSARARLDDSAKLVQADATSFDQQALFGRDGFDRIMLSFSLSMIPDWQAALAQAVSLLAPGGSLHIVDFGDLRGLPWPLGSALRAWLAHFHVTPRLDLGDRCAALAHKRRLKCRTRRGPLGYYRIVVMTRPL
jgi:S-adenosylmethionine-diacylgycerolhomoserine-N-methlytransferase